MTRARIFPCGFLAAITVVLCVIGFGLPQTARAQDRAAQRPCATVGPCFDALTAVQPAHRFARALRRLQNAERRRHGLRRLPASPKLAGAARRHARDMTRRHYFGHVSPANRDVVDRVGSTGYNRGRFAAQENLYWWNPRQPPREVLRAWMASAAHRANILNPRWQHLGLAAVMRSPFGGRGITVVAVFGRR